MGREDWGGQSEKDVGPYVVAEEAGRNRARERARDICKLQQCSCITWRESKSTRRPLARCVTVLTMTLARKVDPGLQDLQTRVRRILAEKNAEKAEESTWIGRMVAAESINDMKALIKSRDSV